MSCQMNSFGAIVDLEGVKKCLYVGGLTTGNLSLSGNTQESKEAKHEDAWNWSVEDSDKPVTHPNWLEECKISLSPSGEIMALTHQQNLVILMAKWDSSEESTSKTKYHMLWHGDPCQEHNEVITSVCVLPLAPPQSQKSLSHAAPDWTCVALGFSSGALRFYTEKGDMLLSEVLDEGPVVSIKCQTMSPARNSGMAELTEELHVIYSTVVCSIYGFVLSNTLRACRNQLARVQANCVDGIVAPPLSLHKWSLPDQDSLTDAAVGLPQCPSAFSHLHIASVCGGYSAWYRPSPPQSSLVVAVGKKPFVGFHYIVEGTSAPVLTDVVKAVGTKLKSAFNQAVPWFLGGRKPNPAPDKEKVVIEPAEPMVCRFGLCDLWRQGCSVVMSPQRNLSVVCDSLGRVTLVDNSSGIALRMWKGYRDAQCGWLVAEEEQPQAHSRKRQALFLVIYSPKKGVVEVWAMQQGPRVATFTTSKHGRLFYISYGLLGVSSLNSRNANRSSTPILFIDEFGVLADITAPFHCALSDKNSKRAKDIHLVRKLRQVLKDDADADTVTALCRDLQTHTVRAQTLDLLASSRKVSANTLLEVVEGFLHWFESQDEVRPDASGKVLMQRCVKLQKLLIFYMFCAGLQQKPPDYDTVVADSSNDFDNLCEFLRMSKQETQRILKFPESQDRVRVKFQEGLEGLSGYLAGFKTDSTAEETIQLVEPTGSQSLVHISEVVCGSLEGNVTEWASAATDSSIAPSALMRLAVVAWLHRRTHPSVADTLTFGQLVSAICNIAGEKVEEPEWWEEVRCLLRESVQSHLAILAAAVCKAVAVTFEETAVMTTSAGTDDSESKSNDWEKVTQESCTWSQLISQLEDVALIGSVLSQKPNCSKVPALHCLHYEPPELSLQNLCSKGRGCVSELVARWIASSGLDPALLLEGSRESSQSPDSSRSDRLGSGVGVVEGQLLSADEGKEAQPTSPEESFLLARLAELRQQFPYSLADNVLLANIAWEYVVAWTKQVDNLQSLQAAVSCLRAIPDSQLKQGVCSMTWMMHVKGRFESTLRLINKVGKVPKERLCRQDIGLSELQIADFFNICSDFFDIFLECRALSEESPKMRVRHEDLWHSSSVPPLQQLALDQPLANYDVLLLLSQCCRALHIMAAFSLRIQRPINAFFDSIGQSVLFADISAHIQLPNHVVDTALTDTRTQFLLRAITAAMATITHHNGEYNMSMAVDWMKQCLLLAADWSIPADPLRRQQCYELYARGYDRLAEEVIPSVNDTSLLGSQLLTVVGHRLRHIMAESSSQLKEQIAHMSPTLSSWISGLAEATVEPSNIDDTLELVVVVSSLVEEESQSKRIATQLLDSLAPIVNKGRLTNR
ncbi:rab3 GTPase-activating protein non-catalytic subunit isoform X2 [Macrosteles quadrilineatus]|uniref:rab3 GTPase-activating protein non-catalytic subunit isoform X2 n=1 Tax=Macrosteles quadrilineatus TaxID=74068 RepID=UPI0023E0C1D1|nr:rab3 GTPase-activating protein non-catalytic subunit isoform X2 [Macrosteles quadrilineatus]